MTSAGMLFSVAWLLCYASATPSLRGNETRATGEHGNTNLPVSGKSAIISNFLDYFDMHQYVNCYTDNGGTNINGVSGYQGQQDTVWHCARKCHEAPSCYCFVWQFSKDHAGPHAGSRNNCWLREKCEINKCQRGSSNIYSNVFDTFIWK
mmetsp:Transcript_2645/g.2869  ORF Transcript_2645/g.2869 Transcript_2645/m.2869 type:complete len:150 (-) Transcript_2645:221-670(-)